MRGNEARLRAVEGRFISLNILLTNTHLLMVRLCLLLYIPMVLLICVVINVWKTQERSEGSKDFVKDLQQGFVSTGGDVVLGQLQERQAVLALTPNVKSVGTSCHVVWAQHVKRNARLGVEVHPALVHLLGEDQLERVS